MKSKDSRLLDRCCLGRQELASRALKENEQSFNKSNYSEILNSLPMEESLMKEHIEICTVFKAMYSEIQNDLIVCFHCY